MDAFFATTAQENALTLVTGNAKHFEKIGIPLLNPCIREQGGIKAE
jgi:predicted nucleic acid-binding protein